MSIFNTYMETDDLLIRNMKQSDATFLLKHFKTEYMCGKMAYLHTDSAINDFISWSNQKRELITQNRWIVLNKTSNEPVATVGFNSIQRSDEKADIGYELGRQHWGKGYTRQIMEKILLFAFKKLMLKELTVEIPSKCHSIHSNMLIMGFKDEMIYEYGKVAFGFSKSFGMSISSEAYEQYLNRSAVLKAHNYRRLVAIFPSLNIKKTRDYYVDYLGFTSMSVLDNDTSVLKMNKDDIEIQLIQVSSEKITLNHQLYGEAVYDAQFIVSDINMLYNEIASLNIKIIEPLKKDEIVSQNFVIEDIDGRYINFKSIE